MFGYGFCQSEPGFATMVYIDSINRVFFVCHRVPYIINTNRPTLWFPGGYSCWGWGRMSWCGREACPSGSGAGGSDRTSLSQSSCAVRADHQTIPRMKRNSGQAEDPDSAIFSEKNQDLFHWICFFFNGSNFNDSVLWKIFVIKVFGSRLV